MKNRKAIERKFKWGVCLLKSNKDLYKVRKKSVIAEACLTVSPKRRAGTKVDYSEPLKLHGIISDNIRSYDRDNSAIVFESPYRKDWLRPRC